MSEPRSGNGPLNDLISETLAAWELREASPQSSRLALLQAAMRIGRDHLASTIYTIAFAYAGTAIPVLPVLARPVGHVGCLEGDLRGDES